MQFKALPLLYAANDDFKNTIRFSMTFVDDIAYDALSYAVEQVQKRYPYFSVKLIQQSEAYVLEENPLPFVISSGNKAVCLNSQESNEHLLAFAFEKNVISVDVSHFICDGNGIAPLVKTLSYYYILQRYGEDGIDKSVIRLVNDPVQEEEYLYPFPETPLPTENGLSYQPKSGDPFLFEPSFFDGDGIYAYHLQIRQKDLMEQAKTNDGSPVSFISVMLHKALMNLFPENEKDTVFEIPHEYRKALGRPLSHDCLARVMFAKLSPKAANHPVETLNTMLRGQVVLGSDSSLDIQAINGMVQLGAYMQSLPLAAKKQTMQAIVSASLSKNTFGVSYSGNISWGGMEKYVKDVHPYAGERKRSGSIALEIFTIGNCFSICVMQPGKNPKFVEQLIHCFEENGIPCTLTGEERFQLADFTLPA